MYFNFSHLLFLLVDSQLVAEPVHLPLDQVRDEELRHHGPWHPDVLHGLDKLLTLTPGARGQGDDEHDVLGQVNTEQAQAEHSHADIFVQNVEN